MRAARFHAFGQRLQVDDVPEPQPGADAGEVLVEMEHIAVNPLDVWVTMGTVADGRQSLPFTPGSEAVGRVDGRPVLVHGHGVGVVRPGVYAERQTVLQDALYPVPDGVDLRAAAAMGVAGVTAWRLVHETAHVSRDDLVLVFGASGGVGSLLVQLCHRLGARVVGQTTSAGKADAIRADGADDVWQVTEDAIDSAAAPAEPTVVFDPLGGRFTPAAVRLLRPFGRIGLFGTSAGHLAETDLRLLYRKSVALLGYSATLAQPVELHAALAALFEELRTGRLQVHIDDELPLERAAEAHQRILDRSVSGKLLLRL